MRYNFAMESLHKTTTRVPSGSPRGQDLARFDVPDSGEFYQHLCPVDHTNNFVSIRGLRSKAAHDKPASDKPAADKPPIDNPAILLIHDVGERTDMYWDCMKYLCDNNHCSYSYDQRGHGVNADISGHLDRFQELVSDLLQVASWLRHLHNGQPPIIVGQGYGAIVATEMAARHPQFITGVVLAAPTLELAWMPGPFKRRIIQIMSEFFPRVKVPKGLHPRFSNPLHRVMGKTMATRLIRSLMGPSQLRLTFAFARELFDAMDSFSRYFQSIKKPVLILKPGNDEVARFESMDQISQNHPDQRLITTRIVANVHHNGFTEGKLPMSSILEEIIIWSQSTVTKDRETGAKRP